MYLFLEKNIWNLVEDILGEGNGTPLQGSCLENPMEEPGRLQSTGSLRVGHDWTTSLSLFTFPFHFHALEKEMANHSSVLAWRIPGTAEPGGLPSMGSHRVGHDWSDLATAAAEDILTFHFWPSVWFDFKKYIKYLLYQKRLLKEFEVESSRDILDSLERMRFVSICFYTKLSTIACFM